MQSSSKSSRRSVRHLLSVPALVLALAACGSDDDSSGGEIPGSSSMTIQSCALGCTGPAAGPLSCSINEVFVNQDIWVEFTNKVDLTSVTKSTFQIIETATGIAPSGSFLLDPNNPRRVIFRPQLTFDASGNPNFGLNAASFYSIRIPGVLGGGQGPFIRNLSGSPNLVQLECAVSTGAGVFDAVPGAPTVGTFIDVLDPSAFEDDPNGLKCANAEALETFSMGGADEVSIYSRLRFEFDDLMNPAALVNPTTSTSNTIRVLLDLNGDPTDLEDQVVLPGKFFFSLDTNNKRTTVRFCPTGGLPTAGIDPGSPRQIVVEVPVQIVDLGGNSIQNPGNRIFTPVAIPQTEVELVEDFDGTELTDTDRSSTFVQTDVESVETVLDGFTPIDTITYTGRIIPGFGGGLGRLGDLVVDTAEVLTLSTGPEIPTVFGPDLVTGPVDEEGAPVTDPEDVVAYHVQTRVLDDYLIDEVEPGTSNIEIVDGVFDFASLDIRPGGQIEFVGENTPRLFVRGRAAVLGSIVSTGGDAPEHDSLEGFGGPGGLGGVNAGAGGAGGDRPDLTGSELANGLTFLGYLHEPDAVIDTSGKLGEGRGGLEPFPGNDQGAGGGGSAWPAVFPGPDREDLGGFEPNNECSSRQAGAPGAGGSFSFFGTGGNYEPEAPGTGDPVPPPLAIPGSNLLKAEVVNLDPDAGGALLGGSGGGGGGAGIIGCRTNGFPLPPQNCAAPFVGTDLFLTIYVDQSGAGGGGGGGALQLQAGSVAQLDGRIDVSGGAGGGPVPVISGGSVTGTNNRRTSPGGGGSGGSVLVQSLEVQVSSVPGTVDISGGVGGFNGIGGGEMRGGIGGPGVLQIQDSPQVSLDPVQVASGIQVFPEVEPEDLEISDYLSLSDWQFVPVGPGSGSAYQTCWLAPNVPYFNVQYIEDDTSDPDPANHTFGWNMKVQLKAPVGVVSYRGDSGLATAFLGTDLETLFGNQVGTSPLVVRFQGVRANQPVADPCNQELDNKNAVIDFATLTPWLNSPEELNTYWNSVFPDNPGTASAFRPNLIRAQILLDHDAAEFSQIEGIVELSIRVQPD